MFFSHLTLSQWQQFEKVAIDFHDRLTILTGPNGSGKTTILNILAQHAGWAHNPVAIPRQEPKSGILRWVLRMFGGVDKSSENKIGTLRYSNNVESGLQISGGGSAQYQIGIVNQQEVKCFYIPSHRVVFRYHAIDQIPTSKKDKQVAFNEVANSIRDRYQGGGSRSSSYFMKNTLLGWIIGGYGVRSPTKAIMPSDAEQIANFEGFEQVLKKILPSSLGFKEIEVRNYEIVFVCNDGEDEFILETASGGISALIDIAWQVYMFAPNDNAGYTVLIDEVENHLHPSMQRRVLQDLVDAFPKARFIVATHSPLIVSSVLDSNVYALIYNENKKIVSSKLDLQDKAKTAAEILDEVLGVSSTMPIWAEQRLNEILRKYASGTVDRQGFANLRKDLAAIGLEKMMPEAIESVLAQQK